MAWSPTHGTAECVRGRRGRRPSGVEVGAGSGAAADPPPYTHFGEGMSSDHRPSFSPHPYPLPKGEGKASSALGPSEQPSTPCRRRDPRMKKVTEQQGCTNRARAAEGSPSPRGERGRGEGERRACPPSMHDCTQIGDVRATMVKSKPSLSLLTLSAKGWSVGLVPYRPRLRSTRELDSVATRSHGGAGTRDHRLLRRAARPRAPQPRRAREREQPSSASKVGSCLHLVCS